MQRSDGQTDLLVLVVRNSGKGLAKNVRLKKRCKVGIKYRLQVELSQADVETIWTEFSRFWGDTTLNQLERVCSNEELGRYQFIANNSIGDELTCNIYLPNEWNIPQLNMLGYISARYRKVDVEEV